MERLTPIDSHALTPLVTASGEDCWNQIGVWGQQKPRCARLQEVIHCRNCDVFTKAGRRLFESAANIEYVGEWADDKNTPASHRMADNNSYTMFRLGNEWLAISTAMVKEVCEVGATHRVPHRNEHVLKGLMSVHGQLLPWISMEGLMGISDDSGLADHRQRCIVIEHEQQAFVFSVMQVQGVMRATPDAMREAPAASVAGDESFIIGVASWLDRDVGCLDGNALFNACNRCLL